MTPLEMLEEMAKWCEVHHGEIGVEYTNEFAVIDKLGDNPRWYCFLTDYDHPKEGMVVYGALENNEGHETFESAIRACYEAWKEKEK